VSLSDRAVAAAHLTAWRVVRHLPEPVTRAAFRQVADVAWRKRGGGVIQLERNLARVLGVEPTDPAVRDLSREGMRSYLRYWAEAFRMPSWDGDEVLARIKIDGEDSLRAEYALGVGVILALPHMANWDHAGAWVATAGMPPTTVAERLNPPELYDAFVAYRQGLGMEVLPLDKNSGTQAIATLARRLRDGKLIALVADRDLTDAGLEVEFFGHTARMPGGPAALSVSTGAGLIPVTTWYCGDHMHLRIHPKVHQPTHGTRQDRIAAMTQSVAGVFEAAIRSNPADWHMLQRLWVDDLRLRHHAVSSPRTGASRTDAREA
jgi:KDO2-lipid IV(A) lauroyltransferase